MRKLVLLLTIIPYFGYSQYKIKGKVEDTNKLPVKYIEVSLQTLDSLIIQSTVTNEEGFFEINDVKKGRYNIVLKYFSEVIDTKIIDIDNTLNLKTISIQIGTTLEDVVVIAKTKIKKELGKYVITNISLSKFAKNKTAYEFLSSVPLLETNPGESSLKIRNKGEASILINGKSVGSNEVALSMIKSIPTSDIKKIEVIKTPDSKYSASSDMGIVNVILKNNKYEGMKGMVSYSTYQSYFNSQYFDSYISYAKRNLLITSGINNENYKSKNKSRYEYEEYINNRQTLIKRNEYRRNKSLVLFFYISYKLNKNQEIGLQVNSNCVDISSKLETQNVYKDILNTQIDSIATSLINTKNAPFYTYSNLNYSIKTDSLNSNIDINLSLYKRNDDENSINNFLYANNRSVNFLQRSDITNSVYNAKVDYRKIIGNDDELNTGLAYTHSKMNNDFFFGNYNGLKYISDPLRSNIFKYEDYTLGGYISYKKIFNDEWGGKIGLRLEHFDSNGKTNTSDNELNIKNTYLFPYLSLLYTPSDNHEFSLDISSSISRPSYEDLNPFIRYTSPNSFKIGNPSLLPILSYELSFNYTFFEDFSFDFEYEFDQDLSNSFDIVSPSNEIKTITHNYGNANSIDLYLIYSNNFFDNNWKFSPSLSYNYKVTKGNYNNISLDYNSSMYYFNIKNQINLSKNNDMFLSLNYGFISGFRGMFGEMNDQHSLTAKLSKSFKNFHIIVGTYDLVGTDTEFNETRKEYGFYKVREYFKTYYLTLRYTFGNKKVKKIQDKDNIDRI